jgi:hypothetical protein
VLTAQTTPPTPSYYLPFRQLKTPPWRAYAQRTSEVCRRDFCAVFGDRPELVLRKTIGGYDFISL